MLTPTIIGEGLSTNVYVHNIPLSWSKDELIKHFSKFGPVISSKVLFDGATKLSRGVGFVRFARHDHATQSISTLNGSIPEGSDKPLVVKFAKAQQNQKSYGPISSSTTSNLAHPYSKPVDPSNISASFVGPAAPTWLAQTAALGSAGTNQSLENPSTYKPYQYNLANHKIEKDLTNLYITELPLNFTDVDIKEMCEKYGTVVSSAILTDHDTKISRGIGFCRFSTKEIAKKALSCLHGTIPKGCNKPIVVAFSNDTTQKVEPDPTTVLQTQAPVVSALALGPQMTPMYSMYPYAYPTMSPSYPAMSPSYPAQYMPMTMPIYAQYQQQLLQQQLMLQQQQQQKQQPQQQQQPRQQLQPQQQQQKKQQIQQQIQQQILQQTALKKKTNLQQTLLKQNNFSQQPQLQYPMLQQTQLQQLRPSLRPPTNLSSQQLPQQQIFQPSGSAASMQPL